MANDASVTMTATVLPDEIAKAISGTLTVSPEDANDKWYYKLTSVSAASSNLIAGYFTDYDAVDDDTAPTAIAGTDTVKFLLVKNTDAANDIYINLDGGTITNADGDAIKITSGNSMAIEVPNTTVSNINCIGYDPVGAAAATATAIVAALIDDV